MALAYTNCISLSSVRKDQTSISLPSIGRTPSVTFPGSGRNSHIVGARRGLSSRTGKKGTLRDKPDQKKQVDGGDDIFTATPEEVVVEVPQTEGLYSTSPPPVLPGESPDFWEGPQWDAFGFVIEYLWAFGVLFALIACGIAVATYNEGATDFKQTPVYKESVQSQELLEEPDSSDSDVFEGNPTEAAPSLE